MPLKSSPIGFVKLHRHHAAATATRVEFPAPIGQTWRGEGGAAALKTAIAHRLAVCWNVCEGFPTAALLDGALKEICDAVAEGDLPRAKEWLARMDRSVDATGGRLHDCEQCLNSAGQPMTEDWSAEEDF